MAPLVSVVVPTCGRPELLLRCLAALERQSLPRDRFEVMVVVDSKREGPAAARNRGLRLARAPLIAFTDDDCVPDPAWLSRGLEAMAGNDAVCGRIVMPLPERPTDYERDAQELERAEFVTANCFCRKDALERIGGFDERFRMAWREDSDLHFSLLRAGARIAREPEAVVVHPVRPGGWAVSLRQQRKVMFDALLFKKHRRLYRERIRATARWDYYAIVLSLVLALFLASPAGYAALAFWALLTLKFFQQRMRGTSRRASHLFEMAVTSIAIPPLAVFWRIVGALKFRVAFA
jgi:GT2 family glycosyltransferase